MMNIRALSRSIGHKSAILSEVNTLLLGKHPTPAKLSRARRLKRVHDKLAGGVRRGLILAY